MKKTLTETYSDTRKHVVITNELHGLITQIISLYKQRTHQNITGGQVIERLLNNDIYILRLFKEVSE